MTAEFAAMWMASTLCWLTIAKETYSAGFRFSAQTSSPQGQTFDAPTLRAGCNSVVVHWRVLRQHASAATMHGKVDQRKRYNNQNHVQQSWFAALAGNERHRIHPEYIRAAQPPLWQYCNPSSLIQRCP